ncbi:entry exclusion protein TrbK [Sinorhizobium fredii]|uniref:Probable conjugal transfer protein TrbK n=2 Tax=Rhizobium fredii TaxID=380 RepID=TRBK_SINFN|nr:entry exclusion protein TrbK [Sinorhizobium fredii]P55401.1 RecName: Full=Probable conjugal transfer protein TrbK; Flags: Precursor [Sinorhizobium fredii NGR234]AAB92434.1 precursor for probable conjugal transfer protein TrbK [Sinorhizobium fredii NGR234]PDT44400.1 entry exclusion protein TrbK [Sinorhizobium fredii]
MSRAVIIALVILVAAVSTTATALIVNSRASNPSAPEEQRTAKEKFFGAGKALPPIKDGQEMGPRW